MIWGSFSQPLDLRKFPFDRQVFKIKILSESAADDVKFVQDQKRSSGITGTLSVPDWRVTSTNTSGEPLVVIEGDEANASFVLEVHAKRRVQYYVYTMILPLVIIVLMSFTVFWIDPSNFGTQVAVGTTSMLTVVTYRVASVQILPRTAYFTDMDIFIACCTVLVFLAMIMVVMTTVMARRGRADRARWVDRQSRYLFPAAFVGAVALSFFT